MTTAATLGSATNAALKTAFVNSAGYAGSLTDTITGSRSFVRELRCGLVVLQIFVALLLVSAEAHSAGPSSDSAVKLPISDQLSTEEVDAAEIPSPRALVIQPKTAPGLISNLLYIVKHDLVFRDDFYSDKSLMRLLGAHQIQGERASAEIALTVQLLSSGTHRALTPWAASALIRRDARGNASIQVQVNDVTLRPTYDAVEQILGKSWRPWYPSTPTPHARYVAPTAPHGNADMVLHTRSLLATYGIEAGFDPAAKLHHFSISIHPTGKEDPS